MQSTAHRTPYSNANGRNSYRKPRKRAHRWAKEAGKRASRSKTLCKTQARTKATADCMRSIISTNAASYPMRKTFHSDAGRGREWGQASVSSWSTAFAVHRKRVFGDGGGVVKKRAIMYMAKAPAIPAQSAASTLTLPTACFESIAKTMSEKEARRDGSSRILQKAQRECGAAVHHYHRGEMAEGDTLLESATADVKGAMGGLGDEEEGRQWGTLTGAIEQCIKASAMSTFLKEGRLIQRSEVPFGTHLEYLPGVISFTQELQRYGVRQGGQRDMASLQVCLRLVDSLNQELMQFDFKNGPLRVKYDSLKYTVRTLEDTIFELSLQDGVGAPEEEAMEAEEGADVLPKDLLLNRAEFEEMRKTMEKADEEREVVIKACRDMQKAAKNSIFDLHRGDFAKCEAQLQTVVKGTGELMPLVEGSPALRSGSFGGVMEEFAESKLFFHFLTEKRVIAKEEMLPVPVNDYEYLGGLMDLTGEVGRYAVARATKRDVEAVKLCLECVDTLMGQVLRLSSLPSNMSKKLDQCRSTLRKLETIQYELSLSRKSKARTDEAEGDKKGAAGDGGGGGE